MIKYKCPACSGTLEYNTEIQKLKCSYCASVYELSDFRDKNGIFENEAVEDDYDKLQKWTAEETENMYVYLCSSCGGEIIGEKVTGATFCPYCGSHVIISERFSGSLKPEYVIPFRVDRETAKESLKEHIKDKKYIKDAFLKDNRINRIIGLYVPVWLYDGDVSADIRYRNLITDFSASENGYRKRCSFSVKSLPVDGSDKMSDELMESLEPFDVSQAEKFDAGYLAGYFADRYDIDWEKCGTEARKRAEKTAVSLIKEHTNGIYGGELSPDPENSEISFNNESHRYALFPVWILTVTAAGDEKYTFAMNGQTGKFAGNLPLSGKKYVKKVKSVIILTIAALMILFNVAAVRFLMSKGYFDGSSTVNDIVSLLIMNIVPFLIFYVLSGYIGGRIMKKETENLTSVKFRDSAESCVVSGSVRVSD